MSKIDDWLKKQLPGKLNEQPKPFVHIPNRAERRANKKHVGFFGPMRRPR